MEIVIILLLAGGLIGCLFYYSNKLSHKEFSNKIDDHFKPLLDELKNIDQLQFQTVSRDIIYSKTISALLKVVGYLISFSTMALILDFLTIKHFAIHNPGDVLFAMLMYISASFVVFVFPLLSCIWDFTYFKYGLSNQLKHKNIAFEYLNDLPKKILKVYPAVFIASYLISRLAIGVGFIGVLAGTVLFELSISIYFALEVKRIGFAPIFNLVSEKLNEFRGRKNAKHSEQ